MDVSPQPQTDIRDIKSKRQELKRLNQSIPWQEEQLVLAIARRASVEASIVKVEAYELAKNHDGLCNLTPADVKTYDELKSFEATDEPCRRFHGHTGFHSWEGGGIG